MILDTQTKLPKRYLSTAGPVWNRAPECYKGLSTKCFFGVVLQLSGYCFNGLVNGQFVTTKDKQM